MSDFRAPFGFEEALRPPIDIRRARITPAVLRGSSSRHETPGARWGRVVRRAPEVMVKITGRTGDGGHLLRHLDYISRNGRLPLEGPDGERLESRVAARERAADWTMEAAMSTPRRADSPLSRSIILSMPAGVEGYRVEDAARAFARAIFRGRFDYVFALHDEGRHPHVHLSVCALGRNGERLNPRKADLQVWRETFARELRARGLEAEATARRARGVVRKAERLPVRKLRERFIDKRGALPKVIEGAFRDAIATDTARQPWRQPILDRQLKVRRALVAEALRMGRSRDAEDRSSALLIERFIRSLPPPETQRDAILRRLRDERNTRLEPERPGRPRQR